MVVKLIGVTSNKMNLLVINYILNGLKKCYIYGYLLNTPYYEYMTSNRLLADVTTLLASYDFHFGHL